MNPRVPGNRFNDAPESTMFKSADRPPVLLFLMLFTAMLAGVLGLAAISTTLDLAADTAAPIEPVPKTQEE